MSVFVFVSDSTLPHFRADLQNAIEFRQLRDASDVEQGSGLQPTDSAASAQTIEVDNARAAETDATEAVPFDNVEDVEASECDAGVEQLGESEQQTVPTDSEHHSEMDVDTDVEQDDMVLAQEHVVSDRSVAENVVQDAETTTDEAQEAETKFEQTQADHAAEEVDAESVLKDEAADAQNQDNMASSLSVEVSPAATVVITEDFGSLSVDLPDDNRDAQVLLEYSLMLQFVFCCTCNRRVLPDTIRPEGILRTYTLRRM